MTCLIIIYLFFLSRTSREETTSGLENLNDSYSTTTKEPASSSSSDAMLTTPKKSSAVKRKSEKQLSQSNDGIFELLYSVFKKVFIIGGVYLVGYMGWSIAWLITPLILAVTREYFQNAAERRRSVAKAMARTNEKDVITARIKDLPAWVTLSNA